MAALCDEVEGGAIIAGEQTEILPDERTQSRQARHVPGRILEPDNPGMFGQAGNGFVVEPDCGATDGTSYKTMGSPLALAIARKWASIPACVGLL